MPLPKLPYVYIISSILVGGLSTFLYLKYSVDGATNQQSARTEVVERKKGSHVTLSSQKSQKGLELISPLLYGKTTEESEEMSTLKVAIESAIEDDKQRGVLGNASVYLFDFTSGDWIYINPDDMYHPGSLIKVPMLITYLKEAALDPKIMDKRLFFEKMEGIPTQTYTSTSLRAGQSYSVRDLLHYMIAYSDNNATHLLNQNVDLNSFRATFTDLNMAEPDVHDRNYEIDAKRFSEFLMVLYHATYLSKESSQYAIELLSRCVFKDGLLAGVPSSTKVAHKFGEWGDRNRNLHELHESGIVYLNNRTYLLTIMTKGNNPLDLSKELGKLSKIAYDYMSVPGNTLRAPKVRGPRTGRLTNEQV